MIYIKKVLDAKIFQPILLYSSFLPPADTLLFFDIETTGLYWKNSQIYLIGCICREDGNWYLRQWFAQNPKEEEILLREFIKTADRFSCFLHYNGNRFDIPYIQHKCTQYCLNNPFFEKKQKDLYQSFSPLRSLIPAVSLKQKDLEAFLAVNRIDHYSGGDLIPVYQRYLHCQQESDLESLLLHNREDLEGLFSLLSLYGLKDLCTGHISSCRASWISSVQPDYPPELLMQAVSLYPFPVAFSHKREREYLTWKEYKLQVKVTLKDNKIRFYYPDYKNYYYLPEEDYAIHHSLGVYVERSHRVSATRETCYQNLTWKEEWMSDTQILTQYLSHFLQVLLPG